MDGIFFKDVDTLEKVSDENKNHESKDFDETVHVDIPYFAVALALYA